MNRFIPEKPKNQTRVVVAMSGGVDSSVVAALMQEEGYETIGITLQLYDHGSATGKKNACCAGQDIEDARRVCEKIGIPHYVLNYESLFKQSVIEDFADSYMRGETPIPCVKCNQSVKFRDLFAVAKDLGADALVTGHYIRR
jgi:tRNA-specific 2-thiouridylase